ncbi:MAG: hypothetical protein WCK96_08415 [Methylococcales bacterium]
MKKLTLVVMAVFVSLFTISQANATTYSDSLVVFKKSVCVQNEAGNPPKPTKPPKPKPKPQ